MYEIMYKAGINCSLLTEDQLTWSDAGTFRVQLILF